MHERIQSILTNLEAVGEDLLALSDDIWLNIDHNDSEAVTKGAQFKIDFNGAVNEFQAASARLSRLVEDFTEVSTFEAPHAPASAEERERRERIIAALDRRIPHNLEEDFRYKRPVVFTLNGVPFDGTNTWSQVHETLCRYLATLKPDVFDALPDNTDFTSSKGRKYFSRDATDLRGPGYYGRGVVEETNLSANLIRDNIRRLLGTFGIQEDAFIVYLRQDRDAEQEG
ncbi:hypothetical protein [uncultured Thiocystis sp.]|uniref:hypothetical protein n=1 Tax=uncultured Thiocystis sp. TaxID=1202134 RepID=UPI0025EC637E|nr:hypothetical protein [uncultured Thiocystis sp.]